MVTTDTIEGIINGTVSYHYDVTADVLYLRLVSDMQTSTFGETTDAGDIELRDENSDRLVGLTVISWWKRFGKGSLPDSLHKLASQIEPWAGKVAAVQPRSSIYHENKRRKSIGDVGEQFARELLEQSGFNDVRNSNEARVNHPLFDVEARRNGKLFLISVKARNRLQANGKVNPSYNLIEESQHDHIVSIESERDAEFAWIAIQIDALKSTYSAYFGTWNQIGFRYSIPMLPKHTATYERLASGTFDSRLEAWFDNRRREEGA